MTPPIAASDATPEQRSVILAPIAGPYLVNAGAGTGKTYTLARRVAHLVESNALEPRELLVVTFTNKAALEIADRMAIALGSGGDGAPVCTTFHGLAAQIVRASAYESGRSPDVRAVDVPRARVVFHRAWIDLLEGRLGVDTSALPLYDRIDALESSLADVAFARQSSGATLEAFEARALEAAAALGRLPFGWRWHPTSKSKTSRQPARELDEAGRVAEARREALNVRAVTALFRRFEALLGEAAVLTFGSLLVAAVETLRAKPAFAASLRARFRHALVDEFQDTNPQQLALLRGIFGDALVPVLAVGDPRQAIYGWNGADPDGIRRFAELAGCTTFALTRNRRSYQPILDRAHAALTGTAHATLEPLVAHRSPAPELTVACRLFAGDGTLADRRRAEAAAIAHEIATLVASDVAPRAIAIVLRTRTNVALYVDAVAARGIAVRAHGDDGFYDAREVGDALAWLAAVTAPREPAPLVRLLQSPAFGLSDGAVAALRRGADMAALAASTASGVRDADGDSPAVASERRSAAFAAALLFAEPPAELDADERRVLVRFRETAQRIARDAAAPVDALAATIALESGIDAGYARIEPDHARQVRANLAKFVAVARAFARDLPGAVAADLARELRERAESEAPEAEAVLPGDCVTLLTVHRAKGLEWPYVFVADVTNRVFPSTGAGRAPVAAWDSATGALALRYGTDGRLPLRWALRKPHDPATGEARPDAREDEEEYRLFYVALTRAADRVYVSGSLSTIASPLLQPLLDADLPGFGPPDAGAHRTPEVGSTIAEAIPSAASLDPRLHQLVRFAFDAPATIEPARERVVSYTTLAAVKACPRRARLRYGFGLSDDAQREAAPPRPLDGTLRDGLGATRAGTAMHRILERALEMPRSHESLDSIVRRTLLEFEAPDDAGSTRSLLAGAQAALDAVSDLEPIATERAFDATVAGVRVAGTIDLVARDRTGGIVIVDYKTGHLDEPAWALQLALYRRVVRAEAGEDPSLAVVRIRDGTAVRIAVTPVDDAVLDDALGRASALTDDTPRPGPRCADCAFAKILCDAADPTAASAVATERASEPGPA